jgi:stage V sporulation protein G
MEITEVRVKLVEKAGERLRAFCSITLDGAFVVRDLKIIGGTSGDFVAMPSRKLTDRCPKCGCKNHLRARFCNDCGKKLRDARAARDDHGRAKLHADIAHPINTACRESIQDAVMEAYKEEVERSQAPGYKPASFDDFEDYSEDDEGEYQTVAASQNSKAEIGDDDDDDASFSDYNSLIAELRQDARHRTGPSRGGRSNAADRSSLTDNANDVLSTATDSGERGQGKRFRAESKSESSADASHSNRDAQWQNEPADESEDSGTDDDSEAATSSREDSSSSFGAGL